MTELKIRNRTVKKSGDSYHIIIPKGFIEDSNVLIEGKNYDIVFIPVSSEKSVKHTESSEDITHLNRSLQKDDKHFENFTFSNGNLSIIE